MNNNKVNLNIFYQWYISGLIIFGDYWDHNYKWYLKYLNQKKLNINILWLYYEDFHYCFEKQIEKIVLFLNGSNKFKHGNNYKNETIKLNKQQINRIKNVCSFDFMKNEVKNGVIKEPFYQNMYRKGKIDNWKEYLSDEQSNMIDQITYAKFYGTKIRYWNEAKKSIQNRYDKSSKL